MLPKPDPAELLPAETVNSTALGPDGVVRECPLGTGEDRCEWHASGTAGEYDFRGAPWCRRFKLDRRVRPVLGYRWLMGKPLWTARQHLPAP